MDMPIQASGSLNNESRKLNEEDLVLNCQIAGSDWRIVVEIVSVEERSDGGNYLRQQNERRLDVDRKGSRLFLSCGNFEVVSFVDHRLIVTARFSWLAVAWRNVPFLCTSLWV